MNWDNKFICFGLILILLLYYNMYIFINIKVFKYENVYL